MSGIGAVQFDQQALVLNSQTVNGSVQYEHNVDGPSGSVRFAYDANGNRTEKWTNGLFAARYFYDTDNQLKGISFNNDGDYTGAGDYEYVYDPFGRRIKAVEDGVTRYFVYDGLDCVAELDANKNLTKYYTCGLGLGGGIGDIVAEWRLSMTNWYSYNHRGDVTLLTANAGRVTNRLEYTAFGSLSTINYQLSTRSIGFSSKEYDIKSGLSYYGFRYYECHSGTWLTKEPSGYDGPNLYWALYNAPETVIDILGRFGTGINGDVNHPGGGTYKGHTDFVGSDRFDYNKEDYGRNSPSLNPAAHFQELATSLQQVLGSISQCDKEVFESAMHRLQDYYSHVAKGYRWPPGHLPEEIGRQIMTLLGGSIGSGIAHNLGLSPDEDNEAWDKANQETGEYVNRWDENCCR